MIVPVIEHEARAWLRRQGLRTHQLDSALRKLRAGEALVWKPKEPLVDWQFGRVFCAAQRVGRGILVRVRPTRDVIAFCPARSVA
jgi:hypothetical protein